MKRVRIVGLGAAAAAAAAFFLQPHKGAGRRDAVKRGGQRVARHGVTVTGLIGTSRRRGRGGVADLKARIEEALLEALGADGSALQVIIGDGRTITVRGEVGSLDQIRRASEVIEGVRGGAEVVNLIRLRVPSTGGVVPG
jgi:osmotically-inducible protein OsmY